MPPRTSGRGPLLVSHRCHTRAGESAGSDVSNVCPAPNPADGMRGPFRAGRLPRRWQAVASTRVLIGWCPPAGLFAPGRLALVDDLFRRVVARDQIHDDRPLDRVTPGRRPAASKRRRGSG